MQRVCFLLLILVIVLGAVSCLPTHALNYGGWEPSGPVIQQVAVTADNMNASETATITVSWTGIGPFTIGIDVGTTESIPAGTVAGPSPYTWDFTLEEGDTFEWAVTVHDANGGTGATGTYGPVGAALNAASLHRMAGTVPRGSTAPPGIEPQE